MAQEEEGGMRREEARRTGCIQNENPHTYRRVVGKSIEFFGGIMVVGGQSGWSKARTRRKWISCGPPSVDEKVKNSQGNQGYRGSLGSEHSADSQKMDLEWASVWGGGAQEFLRGTGVSRAGTQRS